MPVSVKNRKIIMREDGPSKGFYEARKGLYYPFENNKKHVTQVCHAIFEEGFQGCIDLSEKMSQTSHTQL